MNAFRFWAVALIGFVLIIGLVGLYLSIPLYMMGRSFAGRSAIYHEEILLSAGVVFPITYNVLLGILARLD